MLNPQMAQLLMQLKANPLQMLAKRFSLPAGLHDPNDILNHLVQSGQVTQQQINNAYQMAQRFK